MKAAVLLESEGEGVGIVDVASGKSIWQAKAVELAAKSLAERASLENDLICDVVVVGGGISGALTAYELVQHGLCVVLVDRSDFGEQSTAASTGLLMYELDRPLHELIRCVGKESALTAYRCGLQAIDSIEATAAQIGNTEFSRRSSFFIERRPERVAQLAAEFECRKQFGFDVSWLDGNAFRDISPIPAAGVIRSTGNGQIDPLSYTRDLLTSAERQGLAAFPRTAVHKVLRLRNRFVLPTSRGHITARYVVYTTGYKLGAQLGRRIGNLNSTFALASRPRTDWDGWPDEALLWETGRPYHYARLTHDGRVVLGGQDTPHGEDHRSDALLAKKRRLLVRKFAHWFPSCALEPEFVWAGTFGESDDDMPFIGALPGREREFAAVGYGGNGITFSAIAAETISRLIRGVPDRNAVVFRFGR
jgi:glycine/D-amino acid oxidase-like deaminating enzyme